MASRNVKVETRITCSPNADLSDPSWVYEPEAITVLTPEAAERIDNLEIGTGAETLMRTDRYTTVTLFYVKNKDVSNLVTLTYLSTHGAGTITIDIKAGRELSLPDVNPSQAPTLQASGAACLVDIVMCGES